MRFVVKKVATSRSEASTRASVPRTITRIAAIPAMTPYWPQRR